MKNILIAVSGGISAYKATDVISALITRGHSVKVIATDSALNFVTPHVLNVISNGNYITETPSETKHIELGKWADAFVLVPGTANTIAKLANGFADNLVTTTFLALHEECYKIICPAMNTHMYYNTATKINLAKISQFGCKIIEPVKGLLACGDWGMGKLPATRAIVDEICDLLEHFPIWNFPFKTIKNGDGNKLYRGTTDDSYSFLDFDWESEVEIPTGPHVGAFGVRRRHDVHKGVDLYAEIGDPVYAVEHGIVVDICPFTGEIAGFPWWENTYGVYVEGESGVVVYGEILPNMNLQIGSKVGQSSLIGTVLTVLKKHNGRPRSMLHLELHDSGHTHTEQWEIGKEKPVGVKDPTKYLIKSNKKW